MLFYRKLLPSWWQSHLKQDRAKCYKVVIQKDPLFHGNSSHIVSWDRPYVPTPNTKTSKFQVQEACAAHPFKLPLHNLCCGTELSASRGGYFKAIDLVCHGSALQWTSSVEHLKPMKLWLPTQKWGKNHNTNPHLLHRRPEAICDISTEPASTVAACDNDLQIRKFLEKSWKFLDESLEYIQKQMSEGVWQAVLRKIMVHLPEKGGKLEKNPKKLSLG